ncbi:MAG: NrdH-redoxin [Microbacterium sp. 69-7]|uniref:glutaredoxin family protein n=1 Tax=Microbacterium sp. 69-7 TaxID=1895784 RepID=UPI00096A1466|nr:glutaredoxin family protein [Microbacterium sp. 69-7]OJU47383.1 MAG: NrdH-redoxin [Microbacterium sp. 69-7]
MLAVTIYTTGPACGKCRMTKIALKAKGIPFNEVDISQPENADAREYVTGDLGYSVAPIVVVEDGTGQDHWCDLRLDEVDRVAQINAAA